MEGRANGKGEGNGADVLLCCVGRRPGRGAMMRGRLVVRPQAMSIRSIHDLRRTYGTRRADVVPMHVLQKWMGHSDASVTARFYLGQTEHHAAFARVAFDSAAGFAAQNRAQNAHNGVDRGKTGIKKKSKTALSAPETAIPPKPPRRLELRT